MNDKELADSVVALGVGRKPECDHPEFELWFLGINSFEADEFVRSWVVAGALMEKVDAVYIEALVDGTWQVQATMNAMPTEWFLAKDPPRAITETCCEALGESK